MASEDPTPAGEAAFFREAGEGDARAAEVAGAALVNGAAPVEAAAEAPAAAPAPAKPRLRARLARAGRWIRDHYAVMDPRTAGLFRIVLGLLCAADAIRHWSVARWFYANSGVITNHYLLYRPFSGYNFTIFNAFSTLAEVHVAFALQVFCHLCLAIGWRSRLFAVLGFLWMTSLDNRLVLVENGGYVVVNLVCFYAMFLPLGQRFGVDALVRSYREKKEKTLGDLSQHPTPGWARAPFVSLAALLVVLNASVVYFFNVVNKSGQIWRRGETVHYVLHLDRMVTGLAVFFRELLPYQATRPLAWGTLMLEALLVPWILAPRGRRVTRTLAMAGMWALHGTFGVMMRLGPFSWFMICWSFLLIAPEQWEALERWYRRRAAPRVVVLDRGPLAFAIGRLLARLDRLELLTFEDSAEEGGPLVAARDPASGQITTGLAAARAIVGALPGGRFAWPLLRVATLGLLGPLLGGVSRHRLAIARFFGLTRPTAGRAQSDEPSPLRLWGRAQQARAREAFLAYFAVCAVLQTFAENKSIPPWAKPKLPKLMEMTIVYPRLFQGWGMFAPNPITDDGSLSIEAWTIDGRKVDPFTGKAPDLDLTDARGLELPQIWQDYFNRIRLDRNKVYRQGLKEYLQRWHQETGRPEDELVAFDVYWVRDNCPKPGFTQPTDNTTIALLTWRKPGYKPPPGAPPIPPEPKIESADPPDPKAQQQPSAAPSSAPTAAPAAPPK